MRRDLLGRTVFSATICRKPRVSKHWKRVNKTLDDTMRPASHCTFFLSTSLMLSSRSCASLRYMRTHSGFSTSCDARKSRLVRASAANLRRCESPSRDRFRRTGDERYSLYCLRWAMMRHEPVVVKLRVCQVIGDSEPTICIKRVVRQHIFLVANVSFLFRGLGLPPGFAYRPSDSTSCRSSQRTDRHLFDEQTTADPNSWSQGPPYQE
jgi:hypothetical protein